MMRWQYGLVYARAGCSEKERRVGVVAILVEEARRLVGDGKSFVNMIRTFLYSKD